MNLNDPRRINIPKDELYQKYIVENMSRKDCASFFNVSEKAVIRRLGEYGIKKDTKKRYENICKTTLAHFGVAKSFASPEVIKKSRQTMLDRYGVEYTAQSSTLQKKMQDTMTSRYGKKNYVETKQFQTKSNETCEKKHGVKWPCQFKDCIQALEKAVGSSKPEQHFEKILEKYNIDYEREYPLRGFKYDFKVGDILFEINPSGTHNSNFGLFGKEPKSKMYHFTKHSVAKDFDLQCVHVFDWDDEEKIVKLFLVPKETIYARNCVVKEVDKELAVRFIKDNHLQGYAKDSVRIGLFYEGRIVSIMTFDKPRYNEKYQYELVRYCSDRNVIGGAEKIFKYFVKHYNAESVISYCDLAKFDGKIYRKLGFKSINKPKPSCHWVNLKTGQHITDNLLRQKGFDQLFKTHYGKGSSNEDLMLENDFVQVYDCGQLSLVWNK